MPPTVSVIIPVFNGSNYVREAIDSVLTQTRRDYELLVVDDGSTDETWDIVQSYGDRVRGIRKQNGGVASALNCGIRQAQGEFVAWLSHDDVFLPAKLERQVAFLTDHPELAGCYSDYLIINHDGVAVCERKMPYYPPEQMIRHLLQWMFINGCTVLVRRACFEAEGLFDLRLRWAHDADMWFRLLRHYAFGHIPEALTKYRVHAGQGSRKLLNLRADAHEFWRRCLEDYPLRDIFPELAGREQDRIAQARAQNCLGEIMRGCHADMSLARSRYIRSIRLWPSLQNPAVRRALLLQIWFPSPTWIIHKVLQLSARERQPGPSSNTRIERDESVLLASNLVPCPLL